MSEMEAAVTTRESLEQTEDRLAEARLAQLLEYAQFLVWAEEREDWSRFGKQQLARAYGENEPVYTQADLMPDAMP
jgi:hypothetical protein